MPSFKISTFVWKVSQEIRSGPVCLTRSLGTELFHLNSGGPRQASGCTKGVHERVGGRVDRFLHCSCGFVVPYMVFGRQP